MSAPVLLAVLVAIIALDHLIDAWLRWRRARSWQRPVPAIVDDLFDDAEYRTARAYHAAHQRLGLVKSVLTMVVVLALVVGGGFAWVDAWARALSDHAVVQGLIFFGVLSLASTLIDLPFNLVSTFHIEERWGFNRTTPATFAADRFKSLALTAVVGAPLLAVIIVLYETMGSAFWWAAWSVVIAVSLVANLAYTSWILPFFNTLTPLEEGPLRTAIEDYAARVDFPLDGILVMDGSRRSSKANAFFSGLGRRKRIVLFDTLIEEMDVDEVTAVLAHEVGHYKHRHIFGNLALGIVQTGVLFALFGWVAGRPVVAEALGAAQPSFHISLIAFSLLYTPVQMAIGIAMNAWSRRNEFQADAFARSTYDGRPLASALRRLAKKHLSNLTPDRANVVVSYSHPPIAERLEHLEDAPA